MRGGKHTLAEIRQLLNWYKADSRYALKHYDHFSSKPKAIYRAFRAQFIRNEKLRSEARHKIQRDFLMLFAIRCDTKTNFDFPTVCYTVRKRKCTDDWIPHQTLSNNDQWYVISPHHSLNMRWPKTKCDFTTEILTWFVSEIVIVRHPVSVCVPVNHKVTLSVRAEGTGILCYQWFSEDKEQVCGYFWVTKRNIWS